MELEKMRMHKQCDVARIEWGRDNRGMIGRKRAIHMNLDVFLNHNRISKTPGGPISQIDNVFLAKNKICTSHGVRLNQTVRVRPTKLALTPASCTPGGIGHVLALEFASKGKISLSSSRVTSHMTRLPCPCNRPQPVQIHPTEQEHHLRTPRAYEQ
jgi:hypothetical protein